MIHGLPDADIFRSNCLHIVAANHISISGGWGLTPPLWEEYFDILPEEYKEYFLALKNMIEEGELSHLYGDSAPSIQDRYGELEFPVEVDGRKMIISFTFRGWGDFMSALANQREHYSRYSC